MWQLWVVNDLSSADQFHVNAAEGWVMLQNSREARSELDRVSAEASEHPLVLRAWYGVAGMEELWAEAYDLAVRIVALQPQEPDVWIWRAYAARRMPEGGLEKAWEMLYPALEHFPKEWIVPYNLSCYACQLGRLDEARLYYFQALKLGGTEVRKMALQDPDLESLQKEISSKPDKDAS